MPVYRENVDFFFDKLIKVTTRGGGNASVWAVGSYQGDYILTVIEKKIDFLGIDNIADKPAFFFLDDLMKFSPEWQYDSEALKQARKKAESRSS